MAAGDTDIGTGSTLTFSGFTAQVVSISWSGIDRVAIDSSHMGTAGGKTYVFGDQYDPGEITVEVHFKSNEAPPITGAAATLTVTFPDSQTWAASAGLTGFEMNDPMENLMAATATFKASGDITF